MMAAIRVDHNMPITLPNVLKGWTTAGFLLVVMVTNACSSLSPGGFDGILQSEVKRIETAFAQTMAARDFGAFSQFLDEEAIFLSAGSTLRGKEQIASAWKPFFDASVAPFSWAPQTVEVLESGSLAISTGPVYDPSGKKVATFTSIWRRQEDGQWRIIFDSGS